MHDNSIVRRLTHSQSTTSALLSHATHMYIQTTGSQEKGFHRSTFAGCIVPCVGPGGLGTWIISDVLRFVNFPSKLSAINSTMEYKCFGARRPLGHSLLWLSPNLLMVSCFRRSEEEVPNENFRRTRPTALLLHVMLTVSVSRPTRFEKSCPRQTSRTLPSVLTTGRAGWYGTYPSTWYHSNCEATQHRLLPSVILVSQPLL